MNKQRQKAKGKDQKRAAVGDDFLIFAFCF
jgi:hypothetical protein